MDLVTAVLSTYLDAVSNTITSRYTDVVGAEVQTQRVEHRGQQVSYSYQLWRLQRDSVCADKKANISDYSKCTVAAKDMFGQMCQYLESNPESGWRYKKTKNLYCTAAVQYEPVIASITFDKKSRSEEAKQNCSIATLRVMESNTKKNRREREAACRTESNAGSDLRD